MAAVSVRLEGRIIHAIYTGMMTMELVKDGERQIEALVDRMPDSSILYDCLGMDPPTLKLAMEMKAFDSRIRYRVVRCATAVSDPTTAFMSKVAFALAREHKVFYNDLSAAYQWLEDVGGQAKVPVPPRSAGVQRELT